MWDAIASLANNCKPLFAIFVTFGAKDYAYILLFHNEIMYSIWRKKLLGGIFVRTNTTPEKIFNTKDQRKNRSKIETSQKLAELSTWL